MEIFWVLYLIFWVVTLIYETVCASFIKTSHNDTLTIGGGAFYFFINILSLGLYGIYWCVKAEDYLIKLYESKNQKYHLTYAWQWYFFGSLIFIGPFIAFSSLKSRVQNVKELSFIQNDSINATPHFSQPMMQEYDTMECPYCAEIIKRKAKICRFCNHEIVLQ